MNGDAVNITGAPVTIKVATKIASERQKPNGKRQQVAEWIYKPITFGPHEVRNVDAYAHPRQPMTVIEMLSQGKIVPVDSKEGREFLRQRGELDLDLGDPLVETEDKAAQLKDALARIARLEAASEAKEVAQAAQKATPVADTNSAPEGEVDAFLVTAESEVPEPEPPKPAPKPRRKRTAKGK